MKKIKTTKEPRANLLRMKNGTVVKMSNLAWHNYDLYKKFSEQHSYCVKVTEWVDEKTIKMEKLDIAFTFDDILDPEAETLHLGLTKERLHRAILFFQQTQIDFLNFSLQELPEGKYFYHTDMNLLNCVFTKDDKIKLIDPNSFQITNKVVNASHIAMYNFIMWKAQLVMQRLQHDSR